MTARRGALLAGRLFDDAADFPPGNAPVDQAVAAHRVSRSGPLDPYVGPLVVADRHLAALAALLAGRPEAGPGDGGPADGGPADGGPLRIALVVPAGTDAVSGALEAATRSAGLAVVAVETPAPGDPAQAATELARSLPRGAEGFLELSWTPDPLQAVAGLHAAGVAAKWRTGGLAAEAFPAADVLAGAVVACVRSGVRFKCTAGLHNAVRHTDPATGFEHHGFANLVLATAAALDGAGADDLVPVLELRDPADVADRLRGLPDAALAAARRSFVSLGTCSVREGVADLVELGLLDAHLLAGSSAGAVA